jgi:hypothetical protein
MKRRIIKQKDSFTVTLPIKWIRDNQLENAEINLLQEDNQIIIQPTDVEKQLRKTDVTFEDAERARSIIGGLYRAGYDEINVKFSNPKIIPKLQEAVNSLYGLEMFDIDDKGCTIRTIYKLEKTELESHFGKMIHILKTMQTIIVDDIKRKKLDSKDELSQFRFNILKQRDIIARTIVQQKLLDNQHFPYYTLAFNLWYIARFYYKLYTSFKEIKPTNKSINLLLKTNQYLSHTISEATREQVAEKYESYSKIVDNANKLLDDKKENHKIVSYCISILTLTSSCNSLLLQLNH